MLYKDYEAMRTFLHCTTILEYSDLYSSVPEIILSKLVGRNELPDMWIPPLMKGAPVREKFLTPASFPETTSGSR